MLIGELAKAAGCSRHTIRFYEKIGLILPSDSRRGPNGYKHYQPAVLGRLQLVKQGKLLGFSLGELRQLVRDWEGGKLSKTEKAELMAAKMRAVDQRIEELRQVRRYLNQKLRLLGLPAEICTAASRWSGKAV